MIYTFIYIYNINYVVDISLEYSKNGELNWLKMGISRLETAKTLGLMRRFPWDPPNHPSHGWRFEYRNNHGDLGIPHDLRTPNFWVVEDSWIGVYNPKVEGLSWKILTQVDDEPRGTFLFLRGHHIKSHGISYEISSIKSCFVPLDELLDFATWNHLEEGHINYLNGSC